VKVAYEPCSIEDSTTYSLRFVYVVFSNRNITQPHRLTFECMLIDRNVPGLLVIITGNIGGGGRQQGRFVKGKSRLEKRASFIVFE